MREFVVDPHHLVGRAAGAGFRLGAELPGAGRRGRGRLGGRRGLPPREERAGLRRRRRRSGSGAGAIEADDGWACCVLHWARNCGQVAPPVAPADCACFHSAAQADMTLSAFAPVEPAIAAPKRKAAAAADETRMRMDLFPNPRPEWAGGGQPNRAPDRRQCDFAPGRNAGSGTGARRACLPIPATHDAARRVAWSGKTEQVKTPSKQIVMSIPPRASGSRPAAEIKDDRERLRPDDDARQADPEDALDRLEQFLASWTPSSPRRTIPVKNSPRGVPAGNSPPKALLLNRPRAVPPQNTPRALPAPVRTGFEPPAPAGRRRSPAFAS